jgi:hypothetical protein
MGIEKFTSGKDAMGRPARLQKAIHEGNMEAVHAYAAAGGKASAEKRRQIASENEVLAAKRAEEELARRRQTNEDEYPPELYN